MLLIVKTSTKPLSATPPGENGVGDLMFIEGRHDVKTPFYVHVDAGMLTKEKI